MVLARFLGHLNLMTKGVHKCGSNPHPSFGSRLPVRQACVWQVLPRDQHRAVDPKTDLVADEETDTPDWLESSYRLVESHLLFIFQLLKSSHGV